MEFSLKIINITNNIFCLALFLIVLIVLLKLSIAIMY